MCCHIKFMSLICLFPWFVRGASFHSMPFHSISFTSICFVSSHFVCGIPLHYSFVLSSCVEWYCSIHPSMHACIHTSCHPWIHPGIYSAIHASISQSLPPSLQKCWVFVSLPIQSKTSKPIVCIYHAALPFKLAYPPNTRTPIMHSNSCLLLLLMHAQNTLINRVV